MRPRTLQKKKSRRPLLIGLAALCLGGVGVVAGLHQITLSPKDFEKAKWIETYNTSGNIWNAYMHEDISHNSANWQTYMQEVWARNLTVRSKYYTKLPDLDGSETVCNEQKCL